MTYRRARPILLVDVNPSLSILGQPPDATIGVAYSYTLTYFGGTAPYKCTVVGSVPSGWSFNTSTGVLSHASPDTAGPLSLTLKLRDADYRERTQTFEWDVIALPLQITNNPPNYNAGVAQSFNYVATGGVAPYTWTVPLGILPPGITVDSDGTFHGTTVNPSGTGASGDFYYLWDIRVTDSVGTPMQVSQFVKVTAVAISITNAAPDGQVGAAYTHTYASSGGTGTKVWDVATGSLPGGLSLSSGGVLSGTPTTAGTSTYTVRVTDAGGTIATEAESVGMAYPTLTLTGTYTSTGTVGVAYSSDLTIAGGDGSYSNPHITSGGIPSGTALTIVGSALRLSGTPTSAGSYSFTAAVDSGDGQTATSAQSLTIAATAVLIGGAFTSIGGTTRNRGCRINTDGTLNSTFNPNMDDQVFAITSLPSSKYLLGGQFFTTRSYLAKLNSDGTFDTSFNGSLNSNVNAIAVQGDGKIIIGGAFTSVLSNTRNRIARLNSDLTLDTGYNPNASSVINMNAMVLQGDGKVIVGGSFATIGGGSRTRLARLDTAGALDTGFADAAPDSTVRCVAIDGSGKVMVGGNFVNISGVGTRQYLARLNTDGTLDTSFNASVGTNGFIFAIACLADGRYVVGGNFTTIGGGSRNYLAVLSSTGSLDTSFNANVNNLGVTCLLAQGDGYVIVGGSAFTSIGGGSRTRLARVALADGSLDTGWAPGTCNGTPNILVNA